MRRSLARVCLFSILISNAGAQNPLPGTSTQKNDDARTPGGKPPRVNLNGIWLALPGDNQPFQQFRIEQNGDSVKLCMIPKPETCEKDTTWENVCVSAGGGGACVPDTIAQGQFADDTHINLTAKVPHAGHPEWDRATVLIDDPDHFRPAETLPKGTWVWRAVPRPDDVPCDVRNTSRVTAEFAFYRGKSALDDRHDNEKAACWFRIGAAQGNARSQSILAVFLHDGTAGKKDLPQAFGWAQQSAAKDDLLGEYALAMMYHRGEGTPANPRLAEYWMTKAKAHLPKKKENSDPQQLQADSTRAEIAVFAVASVFVLGMMADSFLSDDPQLREKQRQAAKEALERWKRDRDDKIKHGIDMHYPAY